MTDTKHSEALQLADQVELRAEQATNAAAFQVFTKAVAMIRQQDADLEVMRASYAAARLEIESLRAAQPAGAQVETEYGATEFGWTDWRYLQDGDKRLKALVVSLFGNDHQAFADLEALIDRAPHGQAPAQPAPAAVVGPSAITASIMRDDGGEQPAFCLMVAYRSEKDARAALAMIAAPPEGMVASGSLDHLKLMMEHSAFAGALQLDDALANVDEFARASLSANAVAQTPAHIEAMERAWFWMENQADSQSKGGHATFDLMMLREERDALRAALDAAQIIQPAPQHQARPVTPYTCPKCSALWLHWPAEQSGFGRDTLNCRSTTHCDYCEKGGVEQLQRLERVPAVLAAPQPSPASQGDALEAAKHCLEMGESLRALRRVVNLLLEARRNLGPEDHELRDQIDRLLRDDAARAAQEVKSHDN